MPKKSDALPKRDKDWNSFFSFKTVKDAQVSQPKRRKRIDDAIEQATRKK